jgi:hypothetical protein
MAKTYTLVIAEHGPDDRYEALYSDGQLIAVSEYGPLSAAGVLLALAGDGVELEPAYVDVRPEYDDEVVVATGWPQRLEDIPPDMRL